MRLFLGRVREQWDLQGQRTEVLDIRSHAQQRHYPIMSNYR